MLLSWQTASEENASHFIVERSSNLTKFSRVGMVTASGTTKTRQQYGLLDELPQPGANYYRLVQVDFSGETTTSKSIVAVADAALPGLLVLGNPVSAGQLRLATQNLTDASFKLTTIGGQFVYSQIDTVDQNQLISTPKQPLQTGIYLLMVEKPGRKLIRKILIQ